MAETLKKEDFVELDYTGILKDVNMVFDSTIEAVARKEGIFNPKMSYGTVSICIGLGQILPGLDDSLIGLELGREHEITLSPEKAFGRKDGKLLKLIPTTIFRKQGINPVTGLQVNVDGAVGVIRTVTGGRTVVDFNHPFAGKEVIYRVKLIKKLTDEKDKILALVELALNQKKDSISVDIANGKAVIAIKQRLPEQLLSLVSERIKKTLVSIRDIEFKMPGEKKQEKPAESK
jgi:FKBP-type peptidyl-prolyl cis-trans isomerase 2